MARRTRKRSRSSRRRRRQKGGKAGIAENAGSIEQPVVEEMGHKGGEGHPESPDQTGGKRKRKRKAKLTKKRKKKGKKKTRKRGLNPFFKLMLDAKKKGLASFIYKGKTYKGRKHKRLGMIYKKA